MKKITLLSVITVFFLTMSQFGAAQTSKVLTLDEVLELAASQSTQALMAKNRFRASYWQYRSYKASYLPSLILQSTLPNYSNVLREEQRGGLTEYNRTNVLSGSGSLALQQSIPFSGGTISVNSGLSYTNNFRDEAHGGDLIQLVAQPIINISINQPIFSYNNLKWERKTSPLEYEIAKKNYLTSMEQVNQTAVNNFFGLALAQINVQIAETNLINSDTLYLMSSGRYELGTIAEDELLQMQLDYLNAENNLKQAQMNLKDQENRMRTFLGFTESVNITLDIPYEVPTLQVDPEHVLALALENNPEVQQQELSILNSQSSVARAKANRGLQATLSASYGLNGSSSNQNGQVVNLGNTYSNPLNSNSVRLTLSLPILDWGQRKGQYLMAQYQLELAEVQARQTLSEFEEDVLLNCETFNLQYEQVQIAAQSDTVAQRMYEVSRSRYMIGSNTVLELQNADRAKDTNRRSYIQAIQNYWRYFYTIRSAALYDFLKNEPLVADYDALVE